MRYIYHIFAKVFTTAKNETMEEKMEKKDVLVDLGIMFISTMAFFGVKKLAKTYSVEIDTKEADKVLSNTWKKYLSELPDKLK